MPEWVRLDRKQFLLYRVSHLIACGVSLVDHPVITDQSARDRPTCKTCQEYISLVEQFHGKVIALCPPLKPKGDKADEDNGALPLGSV